MGDRRRFLVAIVALALITAACTGDERAVVPTTMVSTVPAATTTITAPTTTTSTTTTTATTVSPTTTATTTTTTTIPPLGTVVVEGTLPDSLEAIVNDLYRWIADDRNPVPDLPVDLLVRLAIADLTTSPWRTARTVTAVLPTDEKVAVIHVDDDLLFAADEGDGWKVVGAAIAGAPLWLGAEPQFLLVLGSDARPGQIQNRFRADSIHIVAIAPSLDGGTIVGFPRDTYVTKEIITRANESVGLTNLPGGSIKWTNLMASRGPEIMLSTAIEMTGLPISGYVVTGFVASNCGFAKCANCKQYSLWHFKLMIFPNQTGVEPPNEDLKDEIKADYLEASNILNKSPRGAAALLRLCVQKLCVQLKEKGENLNYDIGELVNKGLDVEIQQALDVVRVTGNYAVHPGQIDLKDDLKSASA